MNAVIYTRYSPGGEQTDQSTEGQLRDCYEYCAREGLTVIGEYNDRHKSGRYDNRPFFQSMITDSTRHQFQVVVVWKLDRFARNRYDSAIYKAKLKKNGVKVVSAKEQISDTPEGIILESMLEGMAEYYSANLSQNVKRGQRESIEKGTWLGGLPPLGYKVVDLKLAIDESKAHHMVYAFEQFDKGISPYDILEELTARGFRNQKGKPISYSTLIRSFRNVKYIGKYIYNGKEIKQGCPALIDTALFERVQNRLDKKKHAPAAAKAKIKYLLQGKAFCGHCGDAMVGESGRGKLGKVYHYYACSTKKKRHQCNKKNEKKDFLEWYVVEQTVEYVLTPDRIEEIAAAVVAAYDKDFNNVKVAELEKQINQLDNDIGKLVETLISCPPKAAARVTDKIETLECEKEELEVDLAKMKIASGIRYTVDDIVMWMRQFCRGDLMDEDFRTKIIDTFINSVYVYDDKVVIYYNIKDAKQVSYIEMLDNTEEVPENNGIEDSGGVRISNHPPRHELSRILGFYCQMEYSVS